MQRYELMYLASPKIKDEDLRPLGDQIQGLITKQEGKILEEIEWGKKKLAYPIKHFRHGFYFILYFEMEPSKIQDLETDLKLADDITRYLLIKHDKKSWESMEEQKKRRAEKERQEESDETEDAEKDEKEPETNQATAKEDKVKTKPEKVEEAKDTAPAKEKKEETDKKTTATKKNISTDKDDKKEKAKLDELDKKLDEILDDEIIE